jgi:hypothetical protein
MKLPRLSRPSPSMAVSITALVVAMGGTSYAAATIGTADLRANAVTSAKVKNGALGSNDVKDGSLRAQDLRPGLLDPAADPEAFTRWALVDATGAIVAQSGGFEVVAAYPTLPNTAPEGQPSNALRANGNVYIDANEPLGNNGVSVTLALQNRVDLNGDGITSGRAPGGDVNPEFSGEVAVSMCGVTDRSPTNCAPPGAQNDRAFVVSPRMSDGSVTSGAGTPADPGTRKRFYVILTGDSSDYVGPTG